MSASLSSIRQTTIRSICACLFLLAAAQTSAAADMPAEADSSLSAAAAVQSFDAADVNSDSGMTGALVQQTIIYTAALQFSYLLQVLNTSTLSGGPYSITGVYILMVLSNNLIFRGCLSGAVTCSATVDPVTSETTVRIDINNVAANQTLQIEVDLGANLAGPSSIRSQLYQNEFDPNPNNNLVTTNFSIESAPAIIEGYKYEDLNANGQYDPGEPGINGWEITLIEAGGAQVSTTTQGIDYNENGTIDPDEEGSFEFVNVAPGSYQVHEELPAGWIQSEPSAVYYEGEVAEGDLIDELAFGNYRPASMMGSVFEDEDSNGVFGSAENGLGGRTVTLSGTSGPGDSVNLTTTTAADGSYSFSGLDPGTYTVTTDSPGATYQPTAAPGTVTLISGMTAEAVDFGFHMEGVPQLTLEVDPNPIETEIGLLHTHTATVTNVGTATATEVRLWETYIPSIIRYDGPGTDCFSTADTTGIYPSIECNVGDLAPQQSASIDFRFRALATTAGRSILSFTPVNRVSAEATNHGQFGMTVPFTIADIDIDLGVYRLGAGQSNKAAAGDVDVYVDSTLVFSGVTAGSSTGLQQKPLTHTSPMIHVVAMGETDLAQAMLAQELSLAGSIDEAFNLPISLLLVLTGDATTVSGATTVAGARAASPDAQAVSFAVLHAAPSVGEVEIGGVPVSPGATSAYSEVAPGMHTIEVREVGATVPLEAFVFDWTSSAGQAYLLVLADGPAGLELQGAAADGSLTLPSTSPTAAESDELPDRVRLYANYPNPFNPTTTISYALPAAGDVRLEVFDGLGRRVAVLANGVRQAGRHDVTFDAEGLPSGLYVYRLTAGGSVEARSLVVLK